MDPQDHSQASRTTATQIQRGPDGAQAATAQQALRRLLRSKRYALRVNHKRLSRQHDPQRDQQFRYIARLRRAIAS